MENNTIDVNSFIANASSKSKIIGHNKYQIQLQEANKTIEELKQNLNDKDTELELLKKNMREFHIKFQEKNIETSKLKEQLDSSENNLKTLTIDISKFKSLKEQDQLYIINKCNTLQYENIDLSNAIINLNKMYNEYIDKYNELKLKYQITFELLEKKSNSYDILETTNQDLLNELNLLKELNLKKDEEINTIKQEFLSSQKETTLIKTELYEKDILLGELHKKLELQKHTIRGKYIIQSESEQQELEQEQTQEQEQENFTSSTVQIKARRGVKLSKR